MKYTKPELTATGSALALIQMQTPETKPGRCIDRADLQIYGPANNICDPTAYEADE